MPLLFSYGTLQLESVQTATFGRTLSGRADALPGYAPGLVRITDPELVASLGRTHHENAALTGRDETRVAGTAYEVTDEELERADLFEAPFAYVRRAVALASGHEAWTYVHVGDPALEETP